MKLFISYARVDKPYCVQIAETLEIHQIWYDQRLYAGQQWWKEIQRRLEWCEGFVYLLSPESVASKYCIREFEIAQELGRHIFPVLIHEDTEVPAALKHVQYADLSNGLTTEAVKMLLNSIYIAEVKMRDETPAKPKEDISFEEPQPVEEPVSSLDLASIVSKAAESMETGHYDDAVFLLKQAVEQGHRSRFINLEILLNEAEIALEKQTYLREAEREYKPIAELVKRQATRKLGCQWFQEFRESYPDYDPDSLMSLCNAASSTPSVVPIIAPAKPRFNLPMLEWCKVPDGVVRVSSNGSSDEEEETHYLETFDISKYPVTNAQYQAFLDDDTGYAKISWFDFSPRARKWREENQDPRPPRFKGDDRPRETVTWYEALAFCRWLSEKTGETITLPTCFQWQRAARRDEKRLYPWGNDFDASLANTREAKIKMTTLVMRYDQSLSPFGVYDMAGNVWEWCLDAGPNDSRDQDGEDVRAIYGGSFISDCKRAQTHFSFNLNPEYHYATIGFRIIRKES